MKRKPNNQRTPHQEITATYDGAAEHTQTAPPRSEQLLRLNQIVGKDGILPISRATFYELVKRGTLPKPIKLAARISCWRKADILDFINNSEDGSGKL